MFEHEARGPNHESATILVRRLDPDVPAASYAHPGDAGLDLYSREERTIGPGQRAMLATGIALALPAGYAGFIHPRSGLAANAGITVLNAPGTIDAGYRGEISIVLLNTDVAEPYTIRRADRIAQLVIQAVAIADLVEVQELPGSARGAGGFGSTGSGEREGNSDFFPTP